MRKFWKRKEETRAEGLEPQQESAGVPTRFKQAVASTRKGITGRLGDIPLIKRQIDAEVLEHLEDALIAADIGPRITMNILEQARKEVDRKALSEFNQLKTFIKGELMSVLEKPRTALGPERVVNTSPYVILVVGVNGTGKTTTIGKLAHRFRQEGSSVLLCGADTFRAAANDQLAIWSKRAGVPLIQQPPGSDPAAVVFDSLKAAKSRGTDIVIVDTAGRLHTKINLMQEVQKIRRIAGREVEGAPHEVLLVIDAVTGQNGLEQARQFLRAVEVSGIVLTKLDGTAKGGIVVAISGELNLPIDYVGIGEGIEDLVEFSPKSYVESLFEE